MDGSHGSHMAQWADSSVPGQAEDAWDPNQASSMLYNSSADDMTIVDGGQWQSPQDATGSFNHQQSQAFQPHPTQQMYQNGGWMAQTASDVGVDTANTLQPPRSSLYGSMQQNGHRVQYSQAPNAADLYAMQADPQPGEAMKQHVLHPQFRQAMAEVLVQQTGSSGPMQEQTSGSYPGIQAHPIHTPSTQTISQQQVQQTSNEASNVSALCPEQSAASHEGQFKHQGPHGSAAPQLAPRQPAPHDQLQYSYEQSSLQSLQPQAGRVGAPFQPLQHAALFKHSPQLSAGQVAMPTPAPAPAPAPTAAPAPTTAPAPAPAQAPEPPRLQFINPPGAKKAFNLASHLVLLNGSKTVPAFNYKFKVVEARHSISGKPILGSQKLPCEIERDFGCIYREYVNSPDTVSAAQQDDALNKYRDAMKEIGRPITDPSRGPSKRKERTSNSASTIYSSDEYSESEDDDELPPPPLDGPRPNTTEPIQLAVWDALNIVWTREDVPSMEETRRRFIEFGDFLLRLSKEFCKAVKDGERNFKSHQVQSFLHAIEAVRDYATPYVLKHLGETDKALGALANSLLTLYNKGYKDEDVKGQVVQILGLLSEFTTVSESRYNKEGIRLAKIVPRMAKRFGGEAEELRKKIQAKLWREKKEVTDASAPSSKPAADTDKTSTSTSSMLAAKPSTPSPGANAKTSVSKSADSLAKPSKRAREEDTAEGPAAKKPTGEVRVKKVAAAALTNTTTAVNAAKPAKAAGLLPGKLPGKHNVLSKPSATTKPSTASNTATPSTTAAPKAEACKMGGTGPKTEKKQVTVNDNSSSRLGALLDSISSSTTSKAEESKKKKEATESQEQRAKRLRREKRGAYKVRWKEDDLLVEVRTFVSEEDPDMRTTPTTGANRDRDEGQALRTAFKHKDIEDDEDLALLTASWTKVPILYNFANNPIDQYKDSPFRYREELVGPMDEKAIGKMDGDVAVFPAAREVGDGPPQLYAIVRDGDVSTETEDQLAMKRYENTVLLASYPSKDDIPPSPRSPTRTSDDTPMPDPPKHITMNSSPTASEVLARFQEIQSQGRDAARDSALGRKGKMPTSQAGSAAVNPNLMDALARLGAFGSAPPTQPPQPAYATTYAQKPDQQDRQPQRVMDPRAQVAPQKASAPIFKTRQERDAETLRLLEIVKEVPIHDLKPLPAAPQQQQQQHDEFQRAEEMLAPVFAHFSRGPFPPTEPPLHIQNTAMRGREWHDGMHQGDEAKRQRENMAKAKDVAAALRIITDKVNGPQQALASAAAQPTMQQASQPAAQPPVTLNNVTAWHMYQTLSPEQYALWWQQNAHLLDQAQQQPSHQQPPQQQLSQQYAAAPQPQAAGGYSQAQQEPQQSEVPQFQDISHQLASSTDALQTAQTDPNLAQYIQLAYAIQAQQNQVARPGQQLVPNQQDSQPRSPPGQERSSQNGPGWSSNNNNNNDSVGRHEGNHQPRKKDRHKPIKASLIGTKACLFYRKGKCTKGASCTYRHD